MRERVEREVRRARPADPLAAAQLARCPSSTGLVKEVKRVVPAVPTLFAKAKKDFEVMGYRIPEGWTVFWAVRGKNTFEPSFEEPGRFDPERFAPPRSEDTRHPHAYAPQGPGPAMGHKCPGNGLRVALHAGLHGRAAP